MPDGCADVALIRYSDAAGAKSFYSSRAVATPGFDADAPSSIDGVPTSEVFTRNAPDSHGWTALQAYARGGDIVISVQGAAPAHPNVEATTALIRQIYQQICSQESCTAS